MSLFTFGSGVLLGKRTDIANATPLNFGLVQEVTLDLSYTTKELFGQNQFAVAIGRGTAKMTGKAKMAQISGHAFNSLFFGGAMTSGYTTTAFGELQTVPAATSANSSTDAPMNDLTLAFAASPPGAVPGAHITSSVSGGLQGGTLVASTSGDDVVLTLATAADNPSGTVFTFSPNVAPANLANFVSDWGVVYAATGLPLTYVPYPAVLAQGQYTVNPGGRSLFATADAGTAVLLNYSYNVTAAGQKLSVTSGLIGTTPTFSARLFTTFQGKTVDVYLYNCVSSKLAFGTKLEDFAVPELDFSVFANPAGNVLDWSFAEVS